ncbi:MAG TPA: adhesin, partial [Cutibacterium acnes]|nr:adhesin [Cutibacterium acnes]
TPTPKPTPTPTPAPTSGEATVKPVPGAATTSAATGVTDGSDQGVVRVAGGLGTLPHTGV